jgi:hypothetical protein
VPSGLNPATLCHYQDRLALSGQAADSVADELDGDDQAQDGHDGGVVGVHPVFQPDEELSERAPMAK